MKQIYSVLFLDKKTGQTLRKFDYPAREVPNKYYWEKIKAEQLAFLTKSRDIKAENVVIEDRSTVN